MAGCSPANSAATFSTARARPSACASITTWPGSNVSRTGPARSATSAARLTASMTDAAGITAWQAYSSGNLARYLMKSPAMSLAVSLRSPVSKLISPSAGPGCVLAARAPAPADLGPALTVPGLAPASSGSAPVVPRSEEHTSELQSPYDLVCRLLLEKKTKRKQPQTLPHKKTMVIYISYKKIII